MARHNTDKLFQAVLSKPDDAQEEALPEGDPALLASLNIAKIARGHRVTSGPLTLWKAEPSTKTRAEYAPRFGEGAIVW